MADAGIGERAMQAGADAVDVDAGGTRPVVARDLFEEAARGRHRPHRVRARGADADLEQVENRKEHAVSWVTSRITYRNSSDVSALLTVAAQHLPTLFAPAATSSATRRARSSKQPGRIW